HLPKHGTVKALRLEAPPVELVKQVVQARLAPSLDDPGDTSRTLADSRAGLEDDELPALFPFTEEQVTRIARTEPTLRDMLQQFRHLFDHQVYGAAPAGMVDSVDPAPAAQHNPRQDALPPYVKSVVVVETPAGSSADETVL